MPGPSSAKVISTSRLAAPARRDREGAAPVHRLERIAGEAEEDLPELAFIGEDERQRVDRDP